MGKIINPATNKPFVEVGPSPYIMQLRGEIMHQLRMKYDAAQTTSQNELHWMQADTMGPLSANSYEVRRKLRSRSRYETSNSGYLKGITLSICNDTIGRGPRLQVTDQRFAPSLRAKIDAKFAEYAQAIKLRKKLWQMRYARCETGETFAFRQWRPRVDDAVKIDWKLFEADQISNFNIMAYGTREIDGIRYDGNGDPTEYYLLKEHPGDSAVARLYDPSGTWIGYENVIHWFRQERQWSRGVPETTATLPLWALLRRYTLAVVQNAEIAADFTVLLKSMQSANINPFNGTTSDPSTWFDAFPIDRGLMTVLPDQYDLAQLDPKQPVTVYDVFVSALIQEASRPLLVPRNHALGNSGGYNMSSGTLDRQSYRAAIQEVRDDCQDECLDKIYKEWWYEAIRTPNYFEEEISLGESIALIIDRLPSLRNKPPQSTWRWDEVPEHTDPLKVAQAIDVLFKGGHISDTDVQEGRFNRSVEDHYDNLKEQQKQRQLIGISGTDSPDPTPATDTTDPNGDPLDVPALPNGR